MTQLRLAAVITVSVLLAGSAAMLGLSAKGSTSASYRVPKDAIGKDVLLHLEPATFDPSVTSNVLSLGRGVRGKLIYVSDDWITIEVHKNHFGGQSSGRVTEFLSVRMEQVLGVQVGIATPQ